MYRVIISLIFFISILFANSVEESVWPKGESLITFLNKQQISKDIYFNLSKTDKELCSEIQAGVRYQKIYDDKGILLHTLIPISEEMQIHIVKLGNKYEIDIIPIIFESRTEILSFSLENSPYEDILLHTKNKKLANEFIRSFRKSVNFKRLHRGDKVVIKYIQKIRMGRYHGTPVILGAYMKLKYQKDKYIFQNPTDGRYYDNKGKSLTSVFFKVPLRYNRISSRFTYKRFHPILKRYRAHLGVDYAAPTERKIWATASGKVIHRGRKGGYGHTVIIRHSGGYKSLYAHLSRYNKKVRVGSWVKQGDVIGYVGTSGRSTGPHLHFGLYKNGRAVNPAKVMSYSKKTLAGKQRKTYMKHIASIKDELHKSTSVTKEQFRLDRFDSVSKLGGV
jgi:murein DD-endopeptidase MepM/ murein hydrolase activator NlpD